MARLPISDFLIKRLQEYDPKFEVRKGTAFEQLFFKPLQFIVQPLRDEGDIIQTAQSFRRILLTEDPDAFDEEAVDALTANLFVTRVAGDTASGVARVYFDAAVSREWPANGALFTGSNGKTYTNPSPFAITAVQMGVQIEDGLFYYDIPVVATELGDESDLDINGLVSMTGDPDVISVTNKNKIQGGSPRETNTKLIERTKRSIAVRDLVTGKGFNAIMFENFSNSLTELQPIGMGDLEMMRDILFNTHVGGKVDGWVKTVNIQGNRKVFPGLLVDPTRKTKTTTNVQLVGTAQSSLGVGNIDRSEFVPVVKEVKASTAASITGTADLTAPIDLSAGRHLRITVDGTVLEVDVGGAVITQTSRSEILIRINAAFGVNVAFNAGNGIKVVSTTKGVTSVVTIEDPISLPSAIFDVFGSFGPLNSVGDGPRVYIDGTDYLIDDGAGLIERVVGPVQTSAITGVSIVNDDSFSDPTLGAFLSVQVNDILTINSGPDAGDYRILQVVDPNNLVLDAELASASIAVDYTIRRTGIKNNESVFVEFQYNPLSIDIGKLVRLDPDGKTRGIRPGREDTTITDVAFLRVKQIELVDPITFEPLGEILNGRGGYGTGPYGAGPYGIGAASDYHLIVNSPTERFSAFEDSYIVINQSYQGFSFAVDYEYVPEIEDYHNFCRSETERVLDGDILVKHFIPAYVSGEIVYSVDETDSSVPDNDTLLAMLKDFINLLPAGVHLDYSDVRQFITRTTDPFDRYGSSVKSISLTAYVHNTDGSTTVVSGATELVIPTLNPFPKDTPRPLSPRTSHWIAGEITLTRE